MENNNERFKVTNNVLDKETTRGYYSSTLNTNADNVMMTAGPFGSLVKIIKENGRNARYTKDGQSVLQWLAYGDSGFFCNSVTNDQVEVTRKVKEEVGDGSTTACKLTAILFDKLVELEKETNMAPIKLMRIFDKVVENICNEIKSHAQEFTPETAYKIALISSNGNETIAQNIKSIYEKFGNDVFIDVEPSSLGKDVLKEIDGLYVNAGWYDSVFRNDPDKSQCTLPNPRIYYFVNNIDTPEMVRMLISVVYNNVYREYFEASQSKAFDGSKVHPTVILCPFLSQDAKNDLENYLNVSRRYSNDPKSKPPICIITDIFDDGRIEDIAKLCGCPRICKYIDRNLKEKDIKSGVAPTEETVVNYYGTCELFVGDSVGSKFITPQLLTNTGVIKYQLSQSITPEFKAKRRNDIVNAKFSDDVNENSRIKDAFISELNRYQVLPQSGIDKLNKDLQAIKEPTLSDVYYNILHSLEDQIDQIKANGGSANKIGTIKMRIKSLKAKMVVYQVYGMNGIEQTKNIDFVKDASKNCMSAAKNGVGFACAMEGFFACGEMLYNNIYNEDSIERRILCMIADAYFNYIKCLYEMSFEQDSNSINNLIKSNNRTTGIINLATGEHSLDILSSIDSDICILHAISKMLSLMYPATQTIIDNPHNKLAYTITRV